MEFYILLKDKHDRAPENATEYSEGAEGKTWQLHVLPSPPSLIKGRPSQRG
jgi:hypothetical protein